LQVHECRFIYVRKLLMMTAEETSSADKNSSMRVTTKQSMQLPAEPRQDGMVAELDEAF
jgi:hypothetical protein